MANPPSSSHCVLTVRCCTLERGSFVNRKMVQGEFGDVSSIRLEIRRDAIVFHAPSTVISYGSFVASSASIAAQLGFVGWAFSGAPVSTEVPEPSHFSAFGPTLSPISSPLAAQGMFSGDALPVEVPHHAGDLHFSVAGSSPVETMQDKNPIQASHLSGSSAERYRLDMDDSDNEQAFDDPASFIRTYQEFIAIKNPWFCVGTTDEQTFADTADDVSDMVRGTPAGDIESCSINILESPEAETLPYNGFCSSLESEHEDSFSEVCVSSLSEATDIINPDNVSLSDSEADSADEERSNTSTLVSISDYDSEKDEPDSEQPPPITGGSAAIGGSVSGDHYLAQDIHDVSGCPALHLAQCVVRRPSESSGSQALVDSKKSKVRFEDADPADLVEADSVRLSDCSSEVKVHSTSFEPENRKQRLSRRQTKHIEAVKRLLEYSSDGALSTAQSKKLQSLLEVATAKNGPFRSHQDFISALRLQQDEKGN